MTVFVADGIRKSYGYGVRRVEALRGLSISLSSERALGIAGESGSGKSTLGRILLGLDTPDSGVVTIDGIPLASLPRRGEGSLSRRVQMVFQDAGSSLNPRMTVGDTLREALVVNEINVDLGAETRRLVRQVGLDEEALGRYPFQFSGGQRQRIAIARSIASRPDVLVCDEPTSALDVSVQAAILDLLVRLREESGVALAVITHNLDVVRILCEDVVIMHEGLVVEAGATKDVFSNPQVPYTQTLLEAVPTFAYKPFSALSAEEQREAQNLELQRSLIEAPA